MTWKIFASTFGAIFIAELGDKTQLAAFALSGHSSSRWTVFAAASLALIASTALAVLAGGLVGRHVPALWIKRGAGALFVVMGVLMLLSRPDSPPASSGSTPTTTDVPSPETPR